MDATASSAATWFYEETGHRKGPITEEAIIGLMKTGKISYGSLVWKAGYPEWLKVEDTELRTHLEGVSPPPITGKHVNNTIVWILAFAPLIGLFLEACFAFTVNADTGEAAMDNNKYWFITLALNVGLSYLDENRLKRAGWDTSKFKGMTWLVPVYLFKRAKALNQNLAYFIVWLVCFIFTLTV